MSAGPHEVGRTEIHAYTPTPSGNVIRLRGENTEDGWVDHVELAPSSSWRDDPIHTPARGQGTTPTQIYNQLIEPITDDDGRPRF